MRQFRPVFRGLQKGGAPDPKLAFEVRTLLIQEYRRVLLRDPLLPPELLPATWNGTAAYQLCRNLYRRVYSEADRYMSDEFETADGPLPPPCAGVLSPLRRAQLTKRRIATTATSQRRRFAMTVNDVPRECAKIMWENDTAARHLGISIDVPAEGRAEASMEVREDMVNGHDICHGGYLFALADTAFALRLQQL